MFYDSLSVLSLDLFTSLSFDCVSGSFNFYSTFVVSVITPIVFIAVLLAITLFRRHKATPERTTAVDDQGWKVALLFTFLIFPGVSSTVLKLYRCRLIQEPI